jgi:REP element-mobilizing transposase RayT
LLGVDIAGRLPRPVMRRKRLRLRDFDYATPGAYFVTVCTRDRNPLLVGRVADDVERQLLLGLRTRFPGLHTDEHVVMPNHVHAIFLLDGCTPSLARVVQAFKSLTTLAVSPERRPLWQRGYHEHVIRNDDELSLVREYIRNNPIAELIEIGF